VSGLDFLVGVRSQPEVLARSAATVREALRGPVGGLVLEVLDRRLVAAIGMGASTHAITGSPPRCAPLGGRPSR
jgi:hypothetical protein